MDAGDPSSVTLQVSHRHLVPVVPAEWGYTTAGRGGLSKMVLQGKNLGMRRVPVEHAFWNKGKRTGWFSSLIFGMAEAKDREALSDRTLLGPLWSNQWRMVLLQLFGGQYRLTAGRVGKEQSL